MTEIICKRCQATDYVKNGIVRGLQRYRCRNCSCNFTATMVGLVMRLDRLDVLMVREKLR